MVTTVMGTPGGPHSILITEVSDPEMRVKREQWKAALVGAVTCGVGGPEIGLLLLTFRAVCVRPSIHDAISLLWLPLYWPFALIPFGPPASLLGAIGGMFLQHLAQRTQSLKVVIAEAVVLGAILGSIVPLSTVYGWGHEKDVMELSPLGAATGACCSLLVLYLLQRRHLLRLKPKSTVIL